ncbi:MAG: NAD(P)-dependent glycerol-1-phosphate dehydrogenase [Ignisphaera sp.]
MCVIGMSDVHRIELPKKIIIGSNILSSIGQELKSLNITSSTLVVSGLSTTKLYAKEVVKALEDVSINCWSTYVSKADKTEVENVLNIVKEVKANVIIGVGGGKAIDVAKYSAYLANSYFVSVPTAPSHDGIASPFASIRDMGKPVSMRAATPILVYADVEVIAKAPRRHIIAGCADLLGKLSSVLDWRLAHRLRGEYYGDYAASLALLSAKHILKNHRLFAEKNIPVKAVRILVEALISSGIAMAIAGSTRPASGSEHLIAHAIDVVANYPALHGEEVGIGTIVALYLHGRNWKKVKGVQKAIGAPTTAKELGITVDQLIEALTIAHTIRPERYTILGEKGISREAAEEIIKTTKLDEG